jgi:hypothetical protein
MLRRSVEVRKCLNGNKKSRLDTLIQPDDRMRPDLVGILVGGRHDDALFALAVSAKVCMKPLSRKERMDDLASTCLDQTYLPKPSARARGIDDEPDVTWQDVYDHIPKIYGRCLRLHVVLGGYSLYEKPSEDGEGVSGKRLKTVARARRNCPRHHPQRELSCALSKQISTIAYQNSHAEATSLCHAEKSEKTASAITSHCRLSSVLCPRWQERCAQQSGRSFDGA